MSSEGMFILNENWLGIKLNNSNGEAAHSPQQRSSAARKIIYLFPPRSRAEEDKKHAWSDQVQKHHYLNSRTWTVVGGIVS